MLNYFQLKRVLAFLSLSLFFCTHIWAQNMPAICFVNKDSIYDFGPIITGDIPQYQFEIKNTGNRALTITGVKSKNAGLKFKWPEKPLKPHKKALIYVTFNSKDPIATGSFSTNVFITSNATAEPYPFIHISGTVIPSKSGPVTSPPGDHAAIVPGSTLFYGDPPVK